VLFRQDRLSLKGVQTRNATPVLRDLQPDLDGLVIVTRHFNDVRMTLKTVTIYRDGMSAKHILGKTSRRDAHWYPMVISNMGTHRLHLMSTQKDSLQHFKTSFLNVLQHTDARERARQTIRLNNLKENRLKVYDNDVHFVYRLLETALSRLRTRYPRVSIAFVKYVYLSRC